MSAPWSLAPSMTRTSSKPRCHSGRSVAAVSRGRPTVSRTSATRKWPPRHRRPRLGSAAATTLGTPAICSRTRSIVWRTRCSSATGALDHLGEQGQVDEVADDPAAEHLSRFLVLGRERGVAGREDRPVEDQLGWLSQPAARASAAGGVGTRVGAPGSVVRGPRSLTVAGLDRGALLRLKARPDLSAPPSRRGLSHPLAEVGSSSRAEALSACGSSLRSRRWRSLSSLDELTQRLARCWPGLEVVGDLGEEEVGVVGAERA